MSLMTKPTFAKASSLETHDETRKHSDHLGSEKGGKSHAVYKNISHSDRLNVIYKCKVHKMRKGTISSMLDINYSSVQSIISAFETSGRTNKK
jgi:hypothetical protein